MTGASDRRSPFDKSWFWVASAALFFFVFIYLAVIKVSETDYFAALGSWFGAFGVMVAAYVAFTQLSDLRKSAQFDALARLLEPLYEQTFVQACNRIDNLHPFPSNPVELSALYNQEQGKAIAADIALILDNFERVGLFLNSNLAPHKLLLDCVCLQVVEKCKQLQGYIDWSSGINPGFYTRLKYLKAESERYMDENNYQGPTNFAELLKQKLQGKNS
jgi:hypothetical protein